MKMTLFPSTHFIKRMLKAHSWLGLSLGAVLYLICFTGTLLVFSHQLERWEMPEIEEFNAMSPAAMSEAVQEYRRRADTLPETVYLVLPTPDEPRAHISAGDDEWFISQTGQYLESPREGWVHMLRELHYYLHLPHTIGMIIVGIFGIMLISIVISGVLSHPSIIKDAFKLRIFGQRRLAQTDLHNRLSVWGLPFSLMSATTGAFIGTVSVLIALAAPIYTAGDREELIAMVYGADPQLSSPLAPVNLDAAFKDLSARAPAAQPIYLAFQHLGTDKQFLEIGASFPKRLTYSEIYRYNTRGEYVNHQGLADGPAGRQVAYSVYRLHFGTYGGTIIKWLYIVFGLALSVVAVSGINIWLAKRPAHSFLHRLWAAAVWGLPASLAVSAAVSLATLTLTYLAFWGVYVVLMLTAFVTSSSTKIANACQWLLSASLFVIALGHFAIHKEAQTSLTITVNSVLLFVGLGFAAWQARQTIRQALSKRKTGYEIYEN